MQSKTITLHSPNGSSWMAVDESSLVQEDPLPPRSVRLVKLDPHDKVIHTGMYSLKAELILRDALDCCIYKAASSVFRMTDNEVCILNRVRLSIEDIIQKLYNAMHYPSDDRITRKDYIEVIKILRGSKKRSYIRGTPLDPVTVASIETLDREYDRVEAAYRAEIRKLEEKMGSELFGIEDQMSRLRFGSLDSAK